MTKKEKDTKILLKNVSRLLPVKLTAEEISEAGTALASVVQEIESLKDEHKSIRDEQKSETSNLESRRGKLALRITKGIEDRETQVAIEMHVSGQVSETRLDTGEVLVLREAYEDESQLPLGNEEKPEEAEAKQENEVNDTR